MEGTLYKWINFFLGWKKRYFILKSSILYIYERKGENPKAKIHMAVTEFIQRDRLEIILKTGLYSIYLKAESTDIRDLWFDAMKKIKQEGLNKNLNQEIEMGVPMNINEENFGSYVDNNDKDRNSYIKIDYNSQRDTSSVITGNISPNISPTKNSTKRNSSNTDAFHFDSNYFGNLKNLTEIITAKIDKLIKNNILFNYFLSGADEKKKIADLKNEIKPLYYVNKEELCDIMINLEEIKMLINNLGNGREILTSQGYDKDKTPEKNFSINSNSIKDSNSNSKINKSINKNSLSNTNSRSKNNHHNSPSNFCENINSINCNNGNLITLSECKVIEESDDFDKFNNKIIEDDENYKVEIMNKVDEEREKVNEVLAFPDEVEGTIIYEIVESDNQTNSHPYINTHNSITNTKNSVTNLNHNPIAEIDSSIHQDQIPVSITFDNNSKILNSRNRQDDSFREVQQNSSIIEDKNDYNIYDSNDIYINSAYMNKRSKPPGLRSNYRTGIWSVLKDSIGKEFSKIRVPVFYEEPLSLLQRLCENFQYAYLLNQAAKEDKSQIRICLVSAFILGGFSFPNNRIFKPLNPILGETYEYIDKDLKFRYFAEQVSIDPPISAIRVEGDGYILTSNIIIKSKFQIKKDLLEILIEGNSQIYFTKFDEIITFTKPTISIGNFITVDKKLKIEIIGKFYLTSDKSNTICEIELTEGKFMGSVKVFDEYVENSTKNQEKIIAKINGALCDKFQVHDANSDLSIILCSYKNFLTDDIEKFYFNEFMSNLNNMNDKLNDCLPCTDSRFRKDTEALELQDFETVLKTREKYEENEKLLLKSFILKKLPYEPKYFTKHIEDESREIRYVYCRDYWEDRKNRKFENCPKIFHDSRMRQDEK